MRKRTKKQIILGDISLFLVAIMWGGGFVVTKNTVDIMDPIYLNFLRFFIASVLISVIFRKRIKNITKDEIRYGAMMGSFLFVAFTAVNISIQYTTVSKQAFITASNVVMVPFIVWLATRKKPDTYEIIASIICFVGLTIISFEGQLTINKGDLLSFLGAIFFACHIAAVGYYSRDHDPIRLTIIQFLTVSVLSLVACTIFKSDMSPLSLEAKKGALYMGVFSTFLGFGIQNVAQSYTTSTHAAIILSLESVIGAILAIIILKEKLTIEIIIGCLIVLMAVITAETKWKFMEKRLIRYRTEKGNIN